MTTSNNRHPGFTIVELLVVIVVIGILASITIVSYSGVSKKAIVATLRSDLVDASDQLKLLHLSGGLYPTLQICPVATSDQICLKPSGDNQFNYTAAADRKSFLLTATNGSIVYSITDDSVPALGSGVILAVAGPPSGVTAIAGFNQHTISWVAPASNGGSVITAYKIYRGDAAGQVYYVSVGNVLTYTDTNLVCGYPTHYKVTAVNSVGESLPSGVINVWGGSLPPCP